MQIEIVIDEKLDAPKLVVYTNQMTDEVHSLINKISNETFILTGIRQDCYEIINLEKIIRIYTMDKKTIVTTIDGDYVIRLRLYEIEQKLNGNHYVRISNSEIINLKMAKNFDLSLAGTICVSLAGGITTYVSRRKIAKIKQLLGI